MAKSIDPALAFDLSNVGRKPPKNQIAGVKTKPVVLRTPMGPQLAVEVVPIMMDGSERAAMIFDIEGWMGAQVAIAGTFLTVLMDGNGQRPISEVGDQTPPTPPEPAGADAPGAERTTDSGLILPPEPVETTVEYLDGSVSDPPVTVESAGINWDEAELILPVNDMDTPSDRDYDNMGEQS